MTRSELYQQFADGIERERVKLGLTQERMARELDLSLSSYKRLITCMTEKIDLCVLYRLYLLTGKLMYEFTELSDEYLDLKKKITDLSPSQISFIDGLIEFEKSFADRQEDYEDYVTVYIPTGNMEDGMLYDSSNVEKMKIPSYRRKYGSQISCGIRITSNHLHPVYNKGDTLLIGKRSVRDGDTGIFINKQNGCAYIRKFYQTEPCRLEPIAEYGEIFYVNGKDKNEMDQWIKFGVVLAKMR